MKLRKLFVLTLLTSLLLTSASSIAILGVQAQSDATVVVLDSVGGTTSPTGTNTYAANTVVTLTATPTNGYFVFVDWVVSTDTGANSFTTNPLSLTVEAGKTYSVQAKFDPIETQFAATEPPDLSTAAIVVVLSATGGTTTPEAGRYALGSADTLMLTATPVSGWQFSHWVISGTPMDHGAFSFTATPTDNPYNVNHGYGNTYSYQPVFTPIGTTEPTPIPEFSSIATIIIALALVAAAAGTIAYKRKTK
jgi:hypothetical protein